MALSRRQTRSNVESAQQRRKKRQNKAIQIARAVRAHNYLESQRDLRETQPDEVASEPLEPHEFEDAATSDAPDDSESATRYPEVNQSDGALPILQLPEKLCVPVLFWITQGHNKRLTVRRRSLLRDTPRRLAQEWLAWAIARHIEQSGANVDMPLGWTQVPVFVTGEPMSRAIVGKMAAVLAEVPEALRRRIMTILSDKPEEQLKYRFETDVGDREFALLLPSGEVIAVNALLSAAIPERQATRAGALRLQAHPKPPASIAGEPWSESEWERLKQLQNDASRKAKVRESVSKRRNRRDKP